MSNPIATQNNDLNTTAISLVNIVRTEIITDEAAPKLLTFSTASQGTATPRVSAGEHVEQRVKNLILANNDTEDITIGYDIALNNVVFTPEVHALVDGGEFTIDETNGSFNYSSIPAGVAVDRTRFTLAIYTEEKDYSGLPLSYYRFVFKNSFGAPATMDLQDGVFLAPQYTIKSTPRKGQSPVNINSFEMLPRYAASEVEIEVPDAGETVIFIATAAFTFGGQDYLPGDIIRLTGTV